MRQRLGVAIAVLGNPELLLLDEPMNGLDAGGLETFRTLVQTLRRSMGRRSWSPAINSMSWTWWPRTSAS